MTNQNKLQLIIFQSSFHFLVSNFLIYLNKNKVINILLIFFKYVKLHNFLHIIITPIFFLNVKNFQTIFKNKFRDVIDKK